MAWQTFAPPKAPSQDGYNLQTTARLLTSSFGDGYVQRAPDGANYIGVSATLTWTAIDAADWAAIKAFILANIAVPFMYQLPSDNAPSQWSCSQVKEGAFDGQVWYGNSLPLTRDFTPAV